MTHCSGEAAERQFPGASGAGSDVTFVRDEILIPQIKKIREEKNYDYYLQQLFINIPGFQAQDKRHDSPFTEGGTAREVALGSPKEKGGGQSRGSKWGSTREALGSAAAVLRGKR